MKKTGRIHRDKDSLCFYIESDLHKILTKDGKRYIMVISVKNTILEKGIRFYMSDSNKKMNPVAKMVLTLASACWLGIIVLATGSANRGETISTQNNETNNIDQSNVLMKAAKLKTTMNYYNYGGSILETPIGNLQEGTIICLTGNEYYVDDPNNGRKIRYGRFYSFFEPGIKGSIAIEEELTDGSIKPYMSEIQDVTQEIHSATLNKDVYTTRVGDNTDVSQLTQGLTVYPIGEWKAIVNLGEQQEFVWLNPEAYNYDSVTATATLADGTRITIPTENFRKNLIVSCGLKAKNNTVSKNTKQEEIR